MAPLALILLGGAALGGAYMLTRENKPPPVPTPGYAPPLLGPGQIPGQGPVLGPGGGGGGGPPPMPPELSSAIQMILANPNADPNAVDAFATELETYGYVQEGAMLHAKAADLRANPPPQPASPLGPIPISKQGPIQPQQGQIIANAVFLRADPDENSPVTGPELPMGSVVTIINRSWPPTQGSPEGWTEVNSPAGEHGFIMSRFVAAVADGGGGGGGGIAGIGAVTTARSVRYGVCSAPQGCALRSQPSGFAPAIDLIPHGGMVQILRHVAGAKASPHSRGPGGWCQVRYNSRAGWMPAEWLELQR